MVELYVPFLMRLQTYKRELTPNKGFRKMSYRLVWETRTKKSMPIEVKRSAVYTCLVALQRELVMMGIMLHN
jgi:hypothetical protein